MKQLFSLGLLAFLAGCSSNAPTARTGEGSQTPAELRSLIGTRGSSAEDRLLQAGYEHRNTLKTDTRSIAHWRGKDGGCIEVTTTDGRYASITTVGAEKCADDGRSVASSGTPGAMQTVCGVIVGGNTNRYLCEVEENRQGTTTLRMPDTTLKLTWNLGTSSVQVEQNGAQPVNVKYADAEGETNFRVDERTFFYIANPTMAEMEVKSLKN